MTNCSFFIKLLLILAFPILLRFAFEAIIMLWDLGDIILTFYRQWRFDRKYGGD